MCFKFLDSCIIQCSFTWAVVEQQRRMLPSLETSSFFQNEIYHASGISEVVIFKFGSVLQIGSFSCINVHKTIAQPPKMSWFHGVGGAPWTLAGSSFLVVPGLPREAKHSAPRDRCFRETLSSEESLLQTNTKLPGIAAAHKHQAPRDPCSKETAIFKDRCPRI